MKKLLTVLIASLIGIIFLSLPVSANTFHSGISFTYFYEDPYTTEEISGDYFTSIDVFTYHQDGFELVVDDGKTYIKGIGSLNYELFIKYDANIFSFGSSSIQYDLESYSSVTFLYNSIEYTFSSDLLSQGDYIGFSFATTLSLIIYRDNQQVLNNSYLDIVSTSVDSIQIYFTNVEQDDPEDPEEPINSFNGWTLSGNYWILDDPLPAAGETMTITSPTNAPIEYRLMNGSTVVKDWTFAPVSITVEYDFVMVGIGDFNHSLLIDVEDYSDVLGPYLDGAIFDGFEVRTLTHPKFVGWTKVGDFWVYSNPVDVNNPKTITSPFGTKLQTKLPGVHDWIEVPSQIIVTWSITMAGIGDFFVSLNVIGNDYSRTYGPTSSDVYSTGFQVRTSEPFVDASPIIDGEQYIVVSYHLPISEESIRANLFVWDAVDGDISDQIELVSNDYFLNRNKVGTYEIHYRVEDSSGNEATLVVYVVVQDHIPPVFNFGNDTRYISYSQTIFTGDVGYSVPITDGHDGDVTAYVIENTYIRNTTVIGEYYQKWRAVDASGNEAIMYRYIIVIDGVPPVITGPTVITKSYETMLTASQIIAQFTATDFIEGDVSSNITIHSSAYAGKANTPGSYLITLKAVDSKGNTAYKTLTVTVIDNIPPIWYATNNFLITVDQTVSLSTQQIINTLLIAKYITASEAQNLNLITDEYLGTQTIGTYNVTFQLGINPDLMRTVSIRVVNLQMEEVIYIITFDSNGGTFVGSISTDGYPIPAPTPPTRTGYVFSGWYTDEALTTLYVFGSEVTNDLTLYAKWTVASGGVVITPEPEALDTTTIVIIVIAGLVGASLLFGGKKKRYY